MSSATATKSTGDSPKGVARCADDKGCHRFLQIVGVIGGIALLFNAIYGSLVFNSGPKAVITRIFQGIFGFMVITSEFKLLLMLKWFRFMAPFFGVGIFYIFIAIFAYDDQEWWQLVITIGLAVIGVLNIGFGICGGTRYVAPENEETLERDMAVKYAAQQAQNQYRQPPPPPPASAY